MHVFWLLDKSPLLGPGSSSLPATDWGATLKEKNQVSSRNIPHPQRRGTWLILLPSPSSLCSLHNRPMNLRDVVFRTENDFIQKVSWCKDGRLMFQNNHLVEVWMPVSFIEQRGEGVEEVKLKGHYLASISWNPVWITTNCRKFLKRWGYQTTLPASWDICVQVKKQQLEPDLEQTDWFQIRKGVYVCIWSPCLFNLYIVHYVKFQAGWSTSWTQDCQEKYQ